jgi:hypothetical protein
MILKHKLQALSEIGALHGTGPSPELIILDHHQIHQIFAIFVG